jgi:septation ring formation regulator EzrA
MIAVVIVSALAIVVTVVSYGQKLIKDFEHRITKLETKVDLLLDHNGISPNKE